MVRKRKWALLLLATPTAREIGCPLPEGNSIRSLASGSPVWPEGRAGSPMVHSFPIRRWFLVRPKSLRTPAHDNLFLNPPRQPHLPILRLDCQPMRRSDILSKALQTPFPVSSAVWLPCLMTQNLTSARVGQALNPDLSTGRSNSSGEVGAQ